MGVYIEHHSDLAHRIGHPEDPGSGSQIGASLEAFLAKRRNQLSLSSSVQGIKEDRCIFQDSLIESDGRIRSRNPWAPVGSFAFQIIVLTLLALIPLYHTATLPLPKKEVVTLLYAPPPAAAAAANTSRVRTPTPTATNISIPDPKRISVTKTQEAQPPAGGTVGGVAGGVPDGAVGGVVGGVPGGVFGGLLGNTGSAPVVAKLAPPVPPRIRVASRVVEGNLIHEVTPEYPPEAGRSRIQGTVVLLAVIGRDGSVQDLRVKSGLPVLAQAAMDAVKQWRYRPYLLNGEPVEVDTQITINFTLSGA